MPEYGTVLVPVKPAAKSKIVWTQYVALAAMLLANFGIDLDAGTQAAVVSIIVGVAAVVTWVLRTWFNKTVTP